MNQGYFEGVDKLEKMGAQEDYIIGWESGYLGNPEREEQRQTDAYTAGYADGQNQSFAQADGFAGQKN